MTPLRPILEQTLHVTLYRTEYFRRLLAGRLRSSVRITVASRGASAASPSAALREGDTQHREGLSHAAKGYQSDGGCSSLRHHFGYSQAPTRPPSPRSGIEPHLARHRRDDRPLSVYTATKLPDQPSSTASNSSSPCRYKSPGKSIADLTVSPSLPSFGRTSPSSAGRRAEFAPSGSSVALGKSAALWRRRYSAFLVDRLQRPRRPAVSSSLRSASGGRGSRASTHLVARPVFGRSGHQRTR
jgi:hypothetical protein